MLSIGRKAFGSAIAADERIAGRPSRNKYPCVASSEVLQINADGIYVWTTSAKSHIRGRWRAVPARRSEVISIWEYSQSAAKRILGDKDNEYFNGQLRYKRLRMEG